MEPVTYKDLCDRADALVVCTFKDGVCEAGKTNGCCKGCTHLTEDGCQIDSLCCKLWVCDTKRERMPLATLEVLQRMWDFAGAMQYLVCRGTPATKRRYKHVSVDKPLRGGTVMPLGKGG